MATTALEDILRRAAERPAAILYPEPEDERVVRAAAEAAEAGIARPVLLGEADRLPAELPPGVEARDAGNAAEAERLAAAYAARRGVPPAVAARLVRRPLVRAGMLVALGDADGMVAGAAHATASLLQAAGLTIGYAPGMSVPSSCFLMALPARDDRGPMSLIFADCAVNVAPSPDELASIAVAAAGTARKLLNAEPRVAMLSFSTDGSGAHEMVDAIRQATELARDRITDGIVDGEFQLDTAVSSAVAAKKMHRESPVAGRANVLVFPDLNSGNIAYKAVQHLGGAQAIGPILQGFARPVNDLSRGASVADIVALTAVTVLQARGG
jgi:phosphate acetyltransferase